MSRVQLAILAVAVLGVAGGGAYVAFAGTGDRPAKPSIHSHPANPTNQTAARFTFTSRHPVTFLCSVDSSVAVACGRGHSGAYTDPGPLADGPHTFRVVADAGGVFSDPATRTWTVDTVAPPPPVFTKTPASGAKKATFKYRDAERVKFACRLDGATYARCGSRKTYEKLVAGLHTFCVKAVDRARNVGVPSCFSWVAETGPAAFSISGGPLPGDLLYPGGPAVPVDLVFANPNAVPITVHDVAVTVVGTSADGCAATAVAVTSQLSSTLTIPADSTRSLQELGVPQADWPQLEMADVGNQDACQGANVQLDFTGAAEG